MLFRGQPSGGGEFTREIGMRLEHAEVAFSSEAVRKTRVSAELHAGGRCHGFGPSSISKARSAIQGECSKMPPKASMKVGAVHLGRQRRGRRGGCVSAQLAGDLQARGEPDPVMGAHVVERGA